MILYSRDVTDRKRAEQRLSLTLADEHRKREARLQDTEHLAQDITDRKHAEQLVEEANRRVQLTLDSITDQFFAFDKAGGSRT